MKKPIPSFGDCFNIGGAIGVIAQRFSQLAHRDSKAAVEIDIRVVRPDAIPKFLPRHYLARIFQKDHEQTKGLVLQPYPFAILQEFA